MDRGRGVRGVNSFKKNVWQGIQFLSILFSDDPPTGVNLPPQPLLHGIPYEEPKQTIPNMGLINTVFQYESVEIINTVSQ